MKESKADRFRRVADARVNKIIKMIRLLGNCSGTGVYEYTDEQVAYIFSALQSELDKAKRRFRKPSLGKHRFSLTDQNLVRLSPKEQVPFRCIGCGACCKHVHMQVPVETLDAFRIVKHLQQQGEDIECMDDFWERYTEPALLNECGFFVYFLKTQGPEEACIFLQDNRCRIHTVNPRACRIYPLVVDPKENGRYEYLVSYERKQHFKGPKVHVKTWMKKRFGEEDRAFLTADFGSAKELAQLLRQIPDKRKKRALMCFHWAKYGNFDTGKPFLPQYERNLKVLREYLKELTE